MITYVFITLTLAMIVFLITAKFSFWIKTSILFVFFVMALFSLHFIIKNFDEPVKGSRVITKEEIKSWSNNQKVSNPEK